MAGVDLASTEEMGADATPFPCRAIVYCVLDTFTEYARYMPVAKPNGSSFASLVLGLCSGLVTSPAGRRFIRSYMPEQHRAFYASLESIFVCVRDGGGMPRAMALTGRAGFIHSPSPTELVISSQQAYDTGDCPARQSLYRFPNSSPSGWVKGIPQGPPGSRPWNTLWQCLTSTSCLQQHQDKVHAVSLACSTTHGRPR